MKFAPLVFASLSVTSLGVQGVLAVAVWGQCGGSGYTGSTMCDSGSTCTYVNTYYSQCLPGTSSGGTATTATKTTPASSSGSTSIDARFKAHGKQYFGVCADRGTLSIVQISDIIKASFGEITPENSMKWDATEPSQNSFNFSGMDFVVNWAQTYGKIVRGYTFIWHSQLPSWVSSISSASTLTTVIQNHITVIATRYKGKIAKYDVCNEIFNEDGTLRSTVFSSVLGSTFVDIAFNAAHAADPAAKLYINDYNLDSVNSKVNGLVTFVTSKRSAGIPIHGIGSETRLIAGGAGGVLAALTKLAAAADEVAITALNIAGGSSNDYVTVVKACLAVSKCVGITFCGVSDADSWRSGQGTSLFDSNNLPTTAYNAILNSL